ncbi:MAG: hypothetical protein LBQ23_01315 [Puniceicoccales bacterium]|nr:hypothetical protein [Puniceicoccales bacterium]
MVKNAFRQTAREELLEEVEQSWQTPLSKDTILENHSATACPDLYENLLFDKANSIIIPGLRLINTPLSRVIGSLANLSEINYTITDKNAKGMNIVLLGLGGAENEAMVNLNLKNVRCFTTH